MYVLFVSRFHKVFAMRHITGPSAYDPPEVWSDVSLVDDSIAGQLDCFAEIARVAREEGWRTYQIEVS